MNTPGSQPRQVEKRYVVMVEVEETPTYQFRGAFETHTEALQHAAKICGPMLSGRVPRDGEERQVVWPEYKNIWITKILGCVHVERLEQDDLAP